MNQRAMQQPGLDEAEEELLETFRDLRMRSRTAAEWRTLGKFAHSKALEAERDYEVRAMTVEGQLHLRIRLYDEGTIDRMEQMFQKRNPLPPGFRRRTLIGHRWLEDLGYELMMKGLEAMEQEMAPADSE